MVLCSYVGQSLFHPTRLTSPERFFDISNECKVMAGVGASADLSKKPKQLMMKQSTDFVTYFTTGHPPLISQTSDEEKEVKGACLYLISRK